MAAVPAVGGVAPATGELPCFNGHRPQCMHGCAGLCKALAMALAQLALMALGVPSALCTCVVASIDVSAMVAARLAVSLGLAKLKLEGTSLSAASLLPAATF